MEARYPSAPISFLQANKRNILILKKPESGTSNSHKGNFQETENAVSNKTQ